MSPFDRIIGYDVIKKELLRITDALKNTEAYRALGVSTPGGLLLHGEPGVGKSLMANCLIEASGRRALTIRRDLPDGDFVRAIKNIFEEALSEAPAIVFLDDIDKFAKSEDDCCNQEEFIAVQAAIDLVKGKGVFVLATANDLEILPRSLIRPGRFDCIIEVERPSGSDAPRIIESCLLGKPLAGSVDVNAIARIMNGRTCAELETAMNTAGMLAAYERGSTVAMRHIVMGCVSTLYGIGADHIITGRTDDARDVNSIAARVACHEAGHAVAAEVLSPGSVTLACIHEPQNASRGFVSYAESDENLLEKQLDRVVRILAGRAALELHFGVVDGGSSEDFRRARKALHRMACEDACFGLDLLGAPYVDSQEHLFRQELTITNEMNRCMSRAKRILAENRGFLEAMISGLLQRGLLTTGDIREIRNGSIRKQND